MRKASQSLKHFGLWQSISTKKISPKAWLAPGPVAVDTETMDLIYYRDRLCVVQISDGKGDEHLVRFAPDSAYDAPDLKAVLADRPPELYHFARFDLAAIDRYLGVVAAPVFCTKIMLS